VVCHSLVALLPLDTLMAETSHIIIKVTLLLVRVVVEVISIVIEDLMVDLECALLLTISKKQ
jgi:hypothetical protein